MRYALSSDFHLSSVLRTLLLSICRSAYFAIDKKEASSPDSMIEAKQEALWSYSEELIAKLAAAVPAPVAA